MSATSNVSEIEILEEKISNKPQDLRPLDFLKCYVIDCAYDQLKDKGAIGEDGELQKAIEALRISSTELGDGPDKVSIDNAYDKLLNLGKLIEPSILSQAIKDAILKALVPREIDGEEELKMRFELLFIYRYLPKQLTIKRACFVIAQINAVNINNYQDVITDCFYGFKIKRPDVYPDSDFLKMLRNDDIIEALGGYDPLADLFGVLREVKRNGGSQILVDILPKGCNRDRFIKSFAEFVKEGKYFKGYARRSEFGPSYKDGTLSLFITKLGKDLGFPLEALFSEICSHRIADVHLPMT